MEVELMKNLINILHKTRILASKDNDVQISTCACHHSVFCPGNLPVYPTSTLDVASFFAMNRGISHLKESHSCYLLFVGYLYVFMLRNDESFHALNSLQQKSAAS